jgi:hypothetical protein
MSKSQETKIPNINETVKVFNDSLIELITEIGKIYPDDTEIPVYKTMAETLIKMNALKPIEVFNETILPHEKQIAKKNTKYFIDLDYKKEVEAYGKKVKKDGSQSLMNILKFKDRLKTTPPTDVDYIFGMLNFLCYYGNIYDKNYS